VRPRAVVVAEVAVQTTTEVRSCESAAHSGSNAPLSTRSSPPSRALCREGLTLDSTGCAFSRGP
jgi:hypothetical protein